MVEEKPGYTISYKMDKDTYEEQRYQAKLHDAIDKLDKDIEEWEKSKINK